MKLIEVVEYDPDWPVIFSNLQAVFEKYLPGLIKSIEHVGSTSVPGLAAKPIIDIDLIIANRAALPFVIERSDHLGYDMQVEPTLTEKRPLSRAL